MIIVDDRSHIVLIGASGSGKSTLAPLLAERMGCAYIDTDLLFDKVYEVGAAFIIENFGISIFRKLEENVANQAVMAPHRCIIATGAGTWTIESFRKSVQRRACSIWLNVSQDELERRIEGSDRVIVKQKGAHHVITEQIKTRSALYRLADIEILDKNEPPSEIADNILRMLESKKKRKGSFYREV